MKFDIITIFPKILDSYFKESILGRAKRKGLIEINTHNLRDFSSDKKHHKVDDRPFGGGPGMVMMAGPIHDAVKKIKIKSKSKVILLSAKGVKFDEKMAEKFSKYNQLIFICGRYEGIDERVADYIADYEVSVGDYILSGGELPAAVIIEAVSRFLPGVLGNEESVSGRRYPVYTRPEVFLPANKTARGGKWRVPEVLLSGDHERINKWRAAQSHS